MIACSLASFLITVWTAFTCQWCVCCFPPFILRQVAAGAAYAFRIPPVLLILFTIGNVLLYNSQLIVYHHEVTRAFAVVLKICAACVHRDIWSRGANCYIRAVLRGDGSRVPISRRRSRPAACDHRIWLHFDFHRRLLHLPFLHTIRSKHGQKMAWYNSRLVRV